VCVFPASSAVWAINDPPRASCGLSPMHVSAARQLALVPDVDACALSPLGVEFSKVVDGAGAPPDRDLGSGAANQHPASPLVASALGAIIRGNRVRKRGELFSVGSVGVGNSVCVCVCVCVCRLVCELLVCECLKMGGSRVGSERFAHRPSTQQTSDSSLEEPFSTGSSISQKLCVQNAVGAGGVGHGYCLDSVGL
jgi:hypothetical protein